MPHTTVPMKKCSTHPTGGEAGRMLGANSSIGSSSTESMNVATKPATMPFPIVLSTLSTLSMAAPVSIGTDVSRTDPGFDPGRASPAPVPFTTTR